MTGILVFSLIFGLHGPGTGLSADCASESGNEEAIRWVALRYGALIDEVLVRERTLVPEDPADFTVQLWSSRPPAFLLTVRVPVNGPIVATVSRLKRCFLVEQFLLLKAEDWNRDVVDIASLVELEHRSLVGEQLREVGALVQKLKRLSPKLTVRPSIWDWGSYQYLVTISTVGEQIRWDLHWPSQHPLVRWAESVDKVVKPTFLP